jgi:hypothetical protein
MAIPSNEQVDSGSPINELLTKEGYRDNLGAPIGTIHPWYDYNGTLSVPAQFMLCNGDIINETNYNSTHGSGAWTDEVGTTDLDGLYTPDLNAATNVYLAGGTSTQSGSSAITKTGNTTNQVDIEHLHSWHSSDVSGTPKLYNNAGTTKDVSVTTVASGDNYIATGTSSGSETGIYDEGCWTNKELSSTQDIRPNTVVVKYIIKVV